MSKAIFKKWWFWLIVVFVAMGIILSPSEEERQAEQTKQEQAKQEKEQEKEVNEVLENDFTTITKAKPKKVNDDVTGNWRVIEISDRVDIEKYAESYRDTHMNEGEIHYIINTDTNTVTWLSEMDGLLYVEIREYEKGEEKSAKTLGEGMTLKSYIVHSDGEIEETE